MPAMAPEESPDELLATAAALVVAAAVAVAVVEDAENEVGEAVASERALDVVKGSSDSAGHTSPGSSMNVEFLARAFCVTTEVVAFGLMTPTMA